MPYPSLGILDHNYEHNLFYAHLSLQKLLSGITKLFNDLILLCPLTYLLFMFFSHHWLLFVIMNMFSRVDTSMNSDLVLLCLIVNILGKKKFSHLFEILRISVFVSKFLTTFFKKDNIAQRGLYRKFQERLFYLARQPAAMVLHCAIC